jgi:hypothetical protein
VLILIAAQLPENYLETEQPPEPFTASMVHQELVIYAGILV